MRLSADPHPATHDGGPPRAGPGRLTPPVAIRKVALVANPASGGVGPQAAAEAAQILAGFGLDAEIAAPPPDQLPEALAAAVRGRPDLVVVLAGDGTARLAASLCGPEGPLVA